MGRHHPKCIQISLQGSAGKGSLSKRAQRALFEREPFPQSLETKSGYSGTMTHNNMHVVVSAVMPRSRRARGGGAAPIAPSTCAHPWRCGPARRHPRWRGATRRLRARTPVLARPPPRSSARGTACAPKPGAHTTQLKNKYGLGVIRNVITWRRFLKFNGGHDLSKTKTRRCS